MKIKLGSYFKKKSKTVWKEPINRFLLMILLICVTFPICSITLLQSVNPGPNTSEIIIFQDSILVDSILFYDYSQFRFIENLSNKNLNESNALSLNLRPKLLLLIFCLAFLFSICLPLLILVPSRVLQANHIFQTSRSACWMSFVIGLIMVFTVFILPYSTGYLTSFTQFISSTKLFLKNDCLVFLSLSPVYVLMTLCFWGLILQIPVLLVNEIHESDIDDAIYRLEYSKKSTSFILFVLGVFLSSTIVLTSWLFGEAVEEILINKEFSRFDILPDELLLIQSIVLTIFIFIVYLPVSYLQIGLQNKILKINKLDFNIWDQWEDKHRVLATRLEIGGSVAQKFGASLTLISPLLIYFVTRFFG